MQYEFERALRAARHFRSIGLVPLPSRMDVKRPILAEYKSYREAGARVPAILYSGDEWRTTNLQIMTGARTCGATKVVVVDLDGEQAEAAWKRICAARDYRPQGIWISKTGSGGKHLWFRLPIVMESCATRLLWGLYDPLGGPKGDGGWLAHTEVKLLADGFLAVAPPSRHVKTGVEYQWMGKWSPAVFALPAEAPGWLLDMPGLQLPVKPVTPRLGVCPRPASPNEWKKGPDRNEVIASLPPQEKLRLAVSWGLRLGRNCDWRRGWVECHAVDREDKTPSAGFDPVTGVYHDFGSALKLSFFDLAVALGVYRDWKEAMVSVAG